MIRLKSSALFTAACALLLGLSIAITNAQTLPQDHSSTPGKTGPYQQPTATPQTSTGSQPTPTPTAEALIYGLQGVLIETLDGRTVSTQSADEPFNPASAVKLATALVALKTLGPEYRFGTGIWISGTLDKTTGTVNGNLYISGRDPSFHYEHAVMVARKLNTLGIRTVSGDLVISPGFTLNFNSSPRRSGEGLYDTLDATLRSSEATRDWIYERMVLGDKESLETTPSVAVMGEVVVGPVVPEAKLLLSHTSSKLVDILKVLLCYSNNFMAERIGDSLGGTESVERQIVNSLGIGPGEFRISSLSGLGVNRVTPRVMMKILRALRTELQKQRLTPSDIMPVAGIDPGTLADRFTDLASRASVIAKTGTLTRTDGGASSLVGQMKTASGEVLLFVIMNQHGNVLRFRENQDHLVLQVQNSRGGPGPFKYTAHSLAMKLTDTRSIITRNEEYEPSAKPNRGSQ